MAEERRFASVWDALEDDPQAAATLRLKSGIVMALRRAVGESEMAPSETARRLGLSVPAVEELFAGALDLFSMDELIMLAHRAGLAVRLEVEPVG